MGVDEEEEALRRNEKNGWKGSSAWARMESP